MPFGMERIGNDALEPRRIFKYTAIAAGRKLLFSRNIASLVCINHSIVIAGSTGNLSV